LQGTLNRDDDFHQCCFARVSPHDAHRDSQAPTSAPFGVK
jgi:hypothetical protein